MQPRDGRRNFSLAELQGYVGGYLEAVYPPPSFDGSRTVMFVNEDGKALRLPANPIATALARGVIPAGDVIVGDAVVCTWDEAGEGDEPEEL